MNYLGPQEVGLCEWDLPSSPYETLGGWVTALDIIAQGDILSSQEMGGWKGPDFRERPRILVLAFGIICSGLFITQPWPQSPALGLSEVGDHLPCRAVLTARQARVLGENRALGSGCWVPPESELPTLSEGGGSHL